jgi:NADH dehydrogenase
LLTIVVAGGGQQVLVSGCHFAEMRKNMLKEYPELSTTASNIYLVDGANAVLSPMSKASQEEVPGSA